jgi:glycosyltransferase involved in cell wall biosynthesis
LRIAFVSQPRDPVSAEAGQTGSVAIVLMELARRLAARHSVTVYAPRGRPQPLAQRDPWGVCIRRIAHVARATHKALDMAQGLTGIGQPHFASELFFREYVMQVARSLRQLQPDLVHVMTYPQFVPRLRRAAPAARFVLHLHDETLLHLERARAARRLGAADAIVTCSRWLEQSLAVRFPEFGERIRAIGNGVDPDRFRPPDAPRADDRERRILFVGRVSPEKGVHLLAGAFAELAGRSNGLRLEIVGPVGLLPHSIFRLMLGDPAIDAAAHFYGHSLAERFLQQVVHHQTSYLEQIERRVPQILRPKLGLRGAVPHDRLPEVYRAADIFVSPSICREPFGIPVLEAIASGLPVVATTGGGVPEIVEHGFGGLLVERGSRADLTRAIETLLSEPGRAAEMGAAGRRHALQHFTWRAVAERLEEVYAKLPLAPSTA